MNKVLRSCGTHDGSFHADEVTACALLLLFDCVDMDTIYRSRDPQVLGRCEYVCDVGGIYDSSKKLFDHHQANYHGSYSSAGMVLQHLCDEGKIDAKTQKDFYRFMIKGVDDHDQGKDPLIEGVCTFSHVIANFNTIHYEVPHEEQDKAFFKALEFTLGHISRFWQRRQYIATCRGLVAEAMEKQERVLIFDHALPWLDLFFELGGENHPAEFIVMPAGEHWKVRGIPPTYENRMAVRVPMPLQWAGFLEEELKAISGIDDAVFCHKGRFISVWKTREGALKALEAIYKGEKHGKHL